MTEKHPTKALHILELRARNVKRLKAVRIKFDPDSGLTTITGPNAAGKSSVLDSVMYALCGPKAMKGITMPIRTGTEQASVRIDMGDYVVERKWSGKGSDVTVTNAAGDVYGKAQTFLDARLGNLAFDPLAFANMKPAEQREALLKLVELPFDPDDIATRRAGLYEIRHTTGQTVAQLKGELGGMVAYTADTPEREVSIADLLRELQAARETNAYYANAEAAVEDAQAKVTRLETELADARTALTHAQLEKGLAAAPVNAEDLELAIAGAEDTNAIVRARSARMLVESKLGSAEKQYEAYTEQIAALDKLKAEGVAAAQMPVDGLGFDDDGVTYNGVPFSQASGAEQLRVSMGIAMADDPEIRVILIKDGSLLDHDNLRVIAEMVADKDYQCLIERVDDSGSGDVLIEDGEVVGAEPEPPEPCDYRVSKGRRTSDDAELVEICTLPADHEGMHDVHTMAIEEAMQR